MPSLSRSGGPLHTAPTLVLHPDASPFIPLTMALDLEARALREFLARHRPE